MVLSCHTFLLDQNDGLYRLANAKFRHLLRDPVSCPFPRFAGQRVRMADVIVELLGRQPIRVIRATFAVLTFDDQGCLDASAFHRHQMAGAELALALSSVDVDRRAALADGASRFAAQGGRWAPSTTLARHIEEAALGQLKCPRLCVRPYPNRGQGKTVRRNHPPRRRCAGSCSQLWDWPPSMAASVRRRPVAAGALQPWTPIGERPLPMVATVRRRPSAVTG